MKLSKKVSAMYCSSKVKVCFNPNGVVTTLLIFSGAKFQFPELK